MNISMTNFHLRQAQKTILSNQKPKASYFTDLRFSGDEPAKINLEQTITLTDNAGNAYNPEPKTIRQIQDELKLMKRNVYTPLKNALEQIDSAKGNSSSWGMGIGAIGECLLAFKTGGLSLLLPVLPSWASGEVADYLTEKIMGSFQKAQLDLKKGDTRSFRAIVESVEKNVNDVEYQLEVATDQEKALIESESTIQAAVSADDIDSEFVSLFIETFKTPFTEIQSKNKVIFHQLMQIPEMQQKLAREVARQIEQMGDEPFFFDELSKEEETVERQKHAKSKETLQGILEYIKEESHTRKAYADLLLFTSQPGQPSSQRSLALKRLYQLEKKINPEMPDSKKLYPAQFLQADASEIQHAVLEAMINEKSLRNHEYQKYLLLGLKSVSSKVKGLAMKGLQAEMFVSPAIDLELERIAQAHASYKSKFRDYAVDLLQKRIEAKVYTPFQPAKIANTLGDSGMLPAHELSTMIGYMAGFRKNLENTDNHTANLFLKVEGPQAKFAQAFADTLSRVAFANHQAVYVDLSKTPNLKSIETQLKAEVPLAGKVVVFDNLDKLMDGALPEKRDEILDFLTPVFGLESSQNVDFQDSIVILSTQTPIKSIKSFNTPISKAMASRVLSYGNPLALSERS